jgi:hypothetical protein
MKLSQGFALAAALFHLSAPSTLRAEASRIPQDGWRKVNEEAGTTVYMREVPGTPLIAVRGDADLDAPPAKVLWVIMDCGRAREWVDNLKDCRRLKQVSDTEFVTYNLFGTPIVMKNRDFVARIKISVDPEKEWIEAHFASTEDETAPSSSAIRGEIIESRYRITSLDGGKRSRLVGQALVDPKGSVPKWIVNLFQKKWPVKTMKALRGQVAKPDIVVPEAFQNLLGPSQATASAPVSR